MKSVRIVILEIISIYLITKGFPSFEFIKQTKNLSMNVSLF